MLLLLQATPGWAQSGTWTNLAGGSWATAANWSGSVIADGTDSTADFGTLNLAADATVTLDGARTIGNLTFSDTTATYFNWIINPGSSGPLTMAVSSGTPTITVNNGAAVINTVIAGAGGLRLASAAGAGYVQLNAANTYSGGTIVGNNTQISIGNAQAIGSGSLLFGETVGVGQNYVQAAGADRTITNNIEIRNIRLVAASAAVAGQTAGNLTLSGNVLLNQGASNVRDIFCQKDLTLSGPVSGGPAGLNLVAGRLILQGSNTFTNGVTITGNNASVLNINANAALGAAANVVTFAAPGTLQSGATPINLPTSRNINIISNSIATIDVTNSSYVMTLAGPVTSSATNGALRKVGAGTLVLDSGSGVTNRLTGLSITGGTNEWRSGSLVISSNASSVTAGQFTNGFVNAGNFLLTGGNISATAGDYIFTAGRAGDGGASVFTQNGGIFDGGNNIELLGYGINGVFNLNGGTNICGSIQFQSAGSINLNGGVLNVASIYAMAANLPVYFNGGTLKARQDTTYLFGNSSGQNPLIYIKNGGAFIDSSTFAVQNQLYLRTDSGSLGGGLTKLGTGTLTLVPANPFFAGNMTNTAGTLALGDVGSLGTGSLVLVSNAVLASAANLNAGVTNAILLAGNGTVGTPTQPLKLSGVISGPGALTKTGASGLTLAAVNTYSGGTTNIAGSLLLASPGVSLPGNIHLAGGLLQLGAAEQIADTSIMTFGLAADQTRLQLQGFNETIGGVQDSGGAGVRIVEAAQDNLASKPATLTLNVSGANAYNFGGYVRNGSVAGDTSPLSLIKDGTGTQTFSGSSDLVYYTGPTLINAGVLELSGANSAVNASAITINSGGTVKFSGGGTHSALISGAGNLIAVGATALTLSGINNSYTGITTITNGTIITTTLANGGVNSSIGAAPSAAANLVLADGTLNYGGVTASCDRNFTIAAAKTATLAVGSAVANLTLTGTAPTSTGFLKKIGLGILTLDPGAGSYNVGCLSADAGSLVLKSGTFTTTGTDPSVVGYFVGAGARGGKLVVDGGTLNVTGSGALKLGAAANGNVDILAGSVNASDFILGHGGNVIGTQSGGNVSVTNLYHYDSGNATNTLTGGTLTAKRIYNFTAAVNYFTLILNGGVVRAAPGTARLMDNGGRGGREMDVLLGSVGATIDTSLSDATIARPLDDVSAQAGQLTKIGTGTLTLSSNNTYTGSTIVSAGTLLVNGSLSTGAVTVQTNATLGGTGTIGGSVTFDAGAMALFTNGSQLTIAGGVTLSTNVVRMNLSNNVPIGSYILATCGSSSGAFSSSPTIVSGSLVANTHAVIITTSSNVVLQVATTLALSSSSPTNGYLDNVTFTATVSPTNATGWVVFATNLVALETNSLVAGVAAASLSSLPRGTNLIIAIYSGDGNHLASTNTLNQVVTNHPPVAVAVTQARAKGVSFKIPISELLTNVTDVDGDINTLQNVGAGTNGAAILFDSVNVYYVPSTGANSNANDSFTYTVSDGFGGSATANILVNVISAVGPAQVSPPTNGVVHLTFFGLPSTPYVVQTTTNLDTPWWPLSTNSTGSDGSWQFTDPNATNASQYYRLTQP